MIPVHDLYNNEYEELFEGITDIPGKIKDKAFKIFQSKDKIVKKHEKKINEYRRVLKSNGIDLKYIDKVAKKHANKITRNISKQDLQEAVGAKTGNLFKDQIRDMYNEFFNGSKKDMFENLTYSVLLVVVVYQLNTFLFGIFIVLTGGNVAIAGFLTAVLVAPFTEELTKFISIKEGFSLPYLIAFNVAEFSLYVARYGPVAGPIIIPVRMLSVVMHTLWTIIQRKRYQEGVKHPWKVTAILHAIGNAFASTEAPLLGDVTTFIAYQSEKRDYERKTRKERIQTSKTPILQPV